jgi:hypothetical protein
MSFNVDFARSFNKQRFNSALLAGKLIKNAPNKYLRWWERRHPIRGMSRKKPKRIELQYILPTSISFVLVAIEVLK